jgi:hypothetical protein
MGKPPDDGRERCHEYFRIHNGVCSIAGTLMAGSRRDKSDAALLASIFAGHTVAEAASQAGIGERTAYRRLDDPPFRAELLDLRRRLLDETVEEMAGAAVEAARTLRALLGDGEPPAIRLGAARAVLELGIRLRDQTELSGRLDAMETVVRTRARK